MKILGCWYTNNGINDKILNSSLNSIKNAVNKTKKHEVNVATCNWEKIKNNVFKEYISFYKMGVHLGIILQILRILYEEEKNNNDIVCFLEHDVLYPEDYFDRVGDTFVKNDVNIVSNMDYIGMNNTGWLDVVCRQEPMHQLSYKYSHAVNHLTLLIKECILSGQVLLENSEDFKNRKKIPYMGEKPSCHINHSKHFTSHFNCYAKNANGKIIHPYWGDFKKYYPQNEISMQFRK